MSIQLDLFGESSTASLTNAYLLDKHVLRQRLKRTNFKPENTNVRIERWASEDKKLDIFYTFLTCELTPVMIAATDKGVVYIGLVMDEPLKTINDLRRRFPENQLIERVHQWHTIALEHLNQPKSTTALSFHLKGTDFQIDIWKKLLLIPFGGLVNYKQLGAGHQDSRAVGSAVGSNPVSILIPCHRVIRADGNFDGFFWGNEMKARLLTFEAQRVTHE